MRITQGHLGIRVNCGCGTDIRSDFVNVDCDPIAAPAADVVGDFRAYLRNAREPIAEVLLKHVAEHFSQAEVPSVFREVFDCLVPGGRVVVDGPDLLAMAWHIARQGQVTPKDVQMIYGEQRSQYDFHKSGWDVSLLTTLLTEAGFRQITSRQVGLCFVMTGTKPV